MKKNHLILLLIFTVLSFGKLMAHENNHLTPPDSTTSIVDRSAALLIIEDGKKLYSEGRVRDALIKFRQAAIKDANTWRAPYWIGKCHYHLDNYGYALQYGNQAVQMDPVNIDKDVYELLGKANHRLGNLDEAINMYQIAAEKLSKSSVRDMKIMEKIEQCKYAKIQLAIVPFAVKQRAEGDVNSGYNDYAPILVEGGKAMYFTSRRNNTTGGLLNPEEDQYFEDVYYAKWNDEDKIWDSITNGDKLERVNKTGFDSFSFISKDGLNAMLTINNEAVDEKISTQSSDIFEVQFSNKGKWGNPKKIANKSINTSYFDGAATLTADGNTMYFVSNRNTEKKLTDIYVVQKTGQTWGTAVALSDSINTPGNETTPYISADGRYLFFSSDYHPGMGGFDIFVSENLGNAWSKPVNLGSAINSVNNDTHFQYYPDLQKAVFSTFILQGQKASMDIFEIDMKDFKMPKK